MNLIFLLLDKRSFQILFVSAMSEQVREEQHKDEVASEKEKGGCGDVAEMKQSHHPDQAEKEGRFSFICLVEVYRIEQ